MDSLLYGSVFILVGIVFLCVREIIRGAREKAHAGRFLRLLLEFIDKEMGVPPENLQKRLQVFVDRDTSRDSYFN